MESNGTTPTCCIAARRFILGMFNLKMPLQIALIVGGIWTDVAVILERTVCKISLTGEEALIDSLDDEQ